MSKIALDFDDTITELSPFPITGEVRTDEIERAKELQRQGHVVALWTGRTGKYLKEAIDICKQHGLIFDEIAPCKFVADIYVDSKSVKSLKELKNETDKQ